MSHPSRTAEVQTPSVLSDRALRVAGELASVKERPILFQGAMVRALLAGTKTQTRRAVKPQPYNDPAIKARMSSPGVALFGALADAYVGDEWTCPYGQPGDRLWVRETTRSYYLPNFLTGEPTNALCGQYTADDEPVLNEHEFDYVWWYSRKTCPGIHMPRWACRLVLDITAVRVERLQAISHADAQAEGIVHCLPVGWHTEEGRHFHALDPSQSYLSLWESINGPGSVEANPWVWVVEFRRVAS